MNRRGFLGAILASAVAPAIVRADALMRIVPRETTVYSWDVYSDGPSEVTFSGDLMACEIGRYEGITIIESPLLTRANIAALIKVMKDREIKPDVTGSYWLRLPADADQRRMTSASHSAPRHAATTPTTEITTGIGV